MKKPLDRRQSIKFEIGDESINVNTILSGVQFTYIKNNYVTNKEKFHNNKKIFS